ncbi:MAG: hypothetical protein K6U88_17035 [Dehalococcoidia bacterium]|nr:hypothetical protein [Dehalococcoidia bacterium]
MTRALGLVGAIGSLAASVINLGCCGIGIVAPVAVAGAAGALSSVGSVWGYELMYASLALMLMGLAGSAWRHRRLVPALLGVTGAAALLLAFHDAWDVTAFAALVTGGWLLLGMAVGWDVRLAATACSTPARGLTCGT